MTGHSQAPRRRKACGQIEVAVASGCGAPLMSAVSPKVKRWASFPVVIVAAISERLGYSFVGSDEYRSRPPGCSRWSETSARGWWGCGGVRWRVPPRLLRCTQAAPWTTDALLRVSRRRLRRPRRGRRRPSRSRLGIGGPWIAGCFGVSATELQRQRRRCPPARAATLPVDDVRASGWLPRLRGAQRQRQSAGRRAFR
jgi:hypothetical protein